MTNLENYQLVHPELLTDDTLLQVLRARCIEVPRLKSNNKAELVDIFKRVALPLPQRRYDDSTYLGRKLITLRRTKRQQEATLPNITPITSAADSSLRNNGSGPNQGGRGAERLKPPLASVGTESKKSRLSKSFIIPDIPSDGNKRKSDPNLQEPPGCLKRQKIMWP